MMYRTVWQERSDPRARWHAAGAAAASRLKMREGNQRERNHSTTGKGVRRYARVLVIRRFGCGAGGAWGAGGSRSPAASEDKAENDSPIKRRVTRLSTRMAE